MKVPTYSLLSSLTILLTKAIHSLFDENQNDFSSQALTVAATGAYMNLAVTCYSVANALFITKNHCADYYYNLDHCGESKYEDTENQLIEHPKHHAMLNATLSGVHFSSDYSIMAGMLQSLLKFNLISKNINNSFIPTAIGVPVALSSAMFISNRIGKCRENKFRQLHQELIKGNLEGDLRTDVMIITESESTLKRYAVSDRNCNIYELGILFVAAVILITELLEFGNRERDGYTLRFLI